MMFKPFLSRIRRRRKQPGQSTGLQPSTPTPSRPLTANTIPPIMGNTSSTSLSSPKRRAATIDRASTTSASTATSQYMPGSEVPRSAPRVPEPPAQQQPTTVKPEHEAGIALQVDVQPDNGDYRLADLESGMSTQLAPPEPEASFSAATPRAEPRRISQLEPFDRPMSPDLPEDEDSTQPMLLAPPGLTPPNESQEDAELTHEHEHEHEPQPQIHHVDAAHPVWMPGTYVLINARSGTALDLCGGDQRSLIGFPSHGGGNQQWEFVPSGAGYTIRSVASTERYLTVEDGLCEGATVTASPFPVSWSVQADEQQGAVRIAWSNTDYGLDLAGGASEAPGTKVQLMKSIPGELSQLWRFVRCAQREDNPRAARSHIPPITTETVIVSEERDSVLTTRTTTTTVITTITTVTRTPRERAVAC